MSTADEIMDALIREVATRVRVEPEQVDPDEHFLQEVGLSSLDLLSLLAFAEKKFDIRFPDHQLSELSTLNKVSRAVRKYQEDEERRKS